MSAHYTYFVSLSIPITTHNEVDVKDLTVLKVFQQEALAYLLNPEGSVWVKASLEATADYSCEAEEQTAAVVQEPPARTPAQPGVEMLVSDFLKTLGEEN